MKTQLTAPLAAILLLVSSTPLLAAEPFYAPGMRVTDAAATPRSDKPVSLDWTAMIGTGGSSKPSSSGAATSGTVPDWTSKIGAGSAAGSNSGSKASAKAPVVVAGAGL